MSSVANSVGGGLYQQSAIKTSTLLASLQLDASANTVRGSVRSTFIPQGKLDSIMGQSVGETQSTEERGVRPDAICAIFNSGALRRGVIENRKDRKPDPGF